MALGLCLLCPCWFLNFLQAAHLGLFTHRKCCSILCKKKKKSIPIYTCCGDGKLLALPPQRNNQQGCVWLCAAQSQKWTLAGSTLGLSFLFIKTKWERETLNWLQDSNANQCIVSHRSWSWAQCLRSTMAPCLKYLVPVLLLSPPGSLNPSSTGMGKEVIITLFHFKIIIVPKPQNLDICPPGCLGENITC